MRRRTARPISPAGERSRAKAARSPIRRGAGSGSTLFGRELDEYVPARPFCPETRWKGRGEPMHVGRCNSLLCGGFCRMPTNRQPAHLPRLPYCNTKRLGAAEERPCALRIHITPSYREGALQARAVCRFPSYPLPASKSKLLSHFMARRHHHSIVGVRALLSVSVFL